MNAIWIISRHTYHKKCVEILENRVTLDMKHPLKFYLLFELKTKQSIPIRFWCGSMEITECSFSNTTKPNQLNWFGNCISIDFRNQPTIYNRIFVIGFFPLFFLFLSIIAHCSLFIVQMCGFVLMRYIHFFLRLI